VARVCQRQLILVAWRDVDARWRGGAEGTWNWTSDLELAGSVLAAPRPFRCHAAILGKSFTHGALFTKQLVPAKGGDVLKLGR